jgi:hypothetical protein
MMRLFTHLHGRTWKLAFGAAIFIAAAVVALVSVTATSAQAAGKKRQTLVPTLTPSPSTSNVSKPLPNLQNIPHPNAKAGVSNNVAAKAITMPLTTTSNVPTATTACPTPSIDLKVLVVATDGTEVDLPAITQSMDYAGIPYTTYLAAKTPNGLTADKLASGCHGYYNGIILTNGALAYSNGSTWGSALTSTEWTTLWTYQLNLGIRLVSWYTYPNADYGFQAPSSTISPTTPYNVTLTASGKTAFPYLNSAVNVPILNAYTYLAKSVTDGKATPLVTDAQGNALVSTYTTVDGRQVLAQTFDSNQYMMHNTLLSYGIVNWVTNGLFLGSRTVYASPQIDDIFIGDSIWTATTACGTNVDNTGVTQRMTGTDVNVITKWQTALQSQAISKDVRLTMVFNGEGTVDPGVSPDTLTTALVNAKSKYYWVNHTYDHLLLDAVNSTTATTEIKQNNSIATKYGLTPYSTQNMVTPEVSGLTNAQFLQAAYNQGIRYLVSDTSKAPYNTLPPNTANYSTLVPQILYIPRRANNLFFNVASPAGWASEYNCLYSSYWGRNLSYQEILNVESDTLVGYLLKGEMDPWMFHQANLVAYDGVHSLLSDLLDMTMQKYKQYYTLSITAPTMNSLGATMANRVQYKQAGVTATVTPTTVTFKATKATTFQVTGVKTTGYTVYGGQNISTITLKANQTITYPLA